MEIKLYDCIVKHGGQTGTVHHEIRKNAITEYEVNLLRGMHGSEQVVSVKPVGTKEGNEQEELFKIARAYTTANAIEATIANFQKHLNKSLLGFPEWLVEQHSVEDDARLDKKQRLAGETLTLDLANKGKK